MATLKKPAGISKHKSAAKKPAGENFDIIPASRVKPTNTSRPVITDNEPVQTDNTLAQPGTAPTMHHELKLSRLSASDTDDGPAAADDAVATNAGDTPEVPVGGRSLADILAAKNKAVEVESVPDSVASDEAGTVETLDDETSDDRAVIPLEAKKDDKAQATPEADKSPKPVPAQEAVKETPKESSDETSDDSIGGLVGMEKAEAVAAPAVPELYGGKSVIKIEEPHPLRDLMKALVISVLVLALAAIALNFLIDAEIILSGSGLPHTNLLEP